MHTTFRRIGYTLAPNKLHQKKKKKEAIVQVPKQTHPWFDEQCTWAVRAKKCGSRAALPHCLLGSRERKPQEVMQT